jgi:hypothetical protein
MQSHSLETERFRTETLTPQLLLCDKFHSNSFGTYKIISIIYLFIFHEIFSSSDQKRHFKDGNEILFLMHTVFRIDDIKQKPQRLWKVYLTFRK